MSHYTEVSKSIETLSTTKEEGSGALETFLSLAASRVAEHLQDRAPVYGVTWGDTRTKVTALSPKVRTA